MRKIHWATPDIGEDETKAVNEALESTWIGGNGPFVRKFEAEFAKKVDAQYAIALCNGTCGLMLGLMAIKEEEERIYSSVPTFTFIATANVAKILSYKIELVDADLKTHNIDWQKIDSAATVVIPVDVGGLPCDYDELEKLHHKFILDDAAEALGAEYKGRKIGSIADMTLFSTHSAKICTTGEGGVMTTNNKELYERMKSISNQGYPEKKEPWEYIHPRIGMNFRMPELQAALGLVQLGKLEKHIRQRTESAHIYYDILGETVEFQSVPKDLKHAYFLFTVLVDPRKKLDIMREMLSKGIEVKETWRPIHLQPAYSKQMNKAKMPNSEYLWKRIISLPIHNCLTEEDVKYVAETLREMCVD
jgi:perosamine synthetase